MIRMPRAHITGALFYVTSRGDNKNIIFNGQADYKFYLDLLRKYNGQYGFKLFAFCLLPDHLHLLIELRPGLTISEVMHDLNSNYTKYFNAKYQKKGHLLQERYKLVLAEKETYLMPLSAYIHLNPVLLGLVKDAGEYEYSSYRDYVSVGTGLCACPYPEVKYEDYLKNIPRQEMENLAKALRKKTIIGKDEFIERINQEVLNIAKQAAQCGPQEIKKLRVTNKKFVLAGSTIIIVLSLFTVYFYAKILGLKDSFNKEYHSQMDSYYKEMSKTLQVEKQKAQYLEKLSRGEGSSSERDD